ncbi:1-deoxy-D-xylulose-5-phosphate synthase [Thermosulfuriphilus ammonigenes]|uniref:1-deoxy-D-xylulose-5-phosphate synthase n=1 Tax=Thermosulfuriphilus ammonigenes TaxID=1936021 RepID=A0A6G7PUH5_9BACT|nr:1-deoxy-D-xylulose-5-phosphate synthase [Thermosulfuriphilus ammonigenes]MBA2848591.1 1-deoxy-D-xylulose-5-phosphate synthase [Thermosulfuriphilus ammonigenes]QIJ71270.1 1-deoxy-D-xylulose-5-phosphate synthase [Thermosulfuriphilus ammonigenes]
MTRILDRIDSPKDLKRLRLPELRELAREIRETIIQTVSENGGHLAPNLGTVELTLAIHYVFDAPQDRIVWDVGHQAYAHKLVTGRRDVFHTLRTYGGISGFPKRSESPYDALDTGHSSTSISAGLGMAVAMELQGKPGRVVVVIGDGSMTAGLAFEGLNNTGHIRKNLIVILNDNEMSISPNVGALSSFLSRKLTGRVATRVKKELEGFFRNLPGGDQIVHILKRSEDTLKGFLTPGMLFEALNFEYVGPLPGHRLDVLIPTLKNVKELEGPVLVHVLTKKGKGYPPAEEEPERFHGLGPFDVVTGRPRRKGPRPPDYTQVFGQTMIRLAEEEPRLVAITAAMPTGTGLKDFARRFPERFFDVGICEQHAVTFAAGLAIEGLIPVCAIYSTFLQRSFDQIIHDVCLTKQHVIFALDRGGIVGEDGPTHQGQFDLSYLRLIPNMVVMAPKDENELQHMLYTAMVYRGPIALRYPRGSGVGVSLDWELKAIPIGRAEVLREGQDILVLAIGATVWPALKAAEELSSQGVSVTVVNARFAKPLDEELILDLAQGHDRLMTIEENSLIGGFGSAVAELLADRRLSVPLMRLGIPDVFVEHGSPAILRDKLGLTTPKIKDSILNFLSSEGPRLIVSPAS